MSWPPRCPETQGPAVWVQRAPSLPGSSLFAFSVCSGECAALPPVFVWNSPSFSTVWANIFLNSSRDQGQASWLLALVKCIFACYLYLLRFLRRHLRGCRVHLASPLSVLHCVLVPLTSSPSFGAGEKPIWIPGTLGSAESNS